MSSDNYYVVRKHPLGGFTFDMGFASYDYPNLAIRSTAVSFPTVDAAFKAAVAEHSEYGVSIHEEITQDELR